MTQVMRIRQFAKRKAVYAGIAALLVAALAGGLFLHFSGIASAIPSAGFTTIDKTVAGDGHCKNGNPDINCNIYDGKKFVWMNGGPVAAALGDGTYFFAVLDPGGQADPNDGTPKNLSDTTPSPCLGPTNADGSSCPSG